MQAAAMWWEQGEKEMSEGKKEKQKQLSNPMLSQSSVKWVFNQLAPMSALLSNCVYSSSELLRPGYDPQIYIICT